MKNRLTYLFEFYRASKNLREASRATSYAKKLQSTPRLSRDEKRDMLHAVTGTAPHTFPLPKLVFAGALSVFLIAFVGVLSLSAQPDDGVFYHIRRGVDAVREVVQPGFTPQSSIPLQNDESRKDDHGSDDNSGHGNSRDRGSDSSQDNEVEDSQPSRDDKAEEVEEDSRSGSSGGSDNGTEGNAEHVEGATTDHNSARDACRANLDARKKSGEDIDSDAYKACDSLR